MAWAIDVTPVRVANCIFHAGSRSARSAGIGNWACDWATFLTSWGVSTRSIRMGPDRNAPASLRAPMRPAQGPVAGQAAFTPRRPLAPVHAAHAGASIEEIVQAMSKRLEGIRFKAVRACCRAPQPGASVITVPCRHRLQHAGRRMRVACTQGEQQSEGSPVSAPQRKAAPAAAAVVVEPPVLGRKAPPPPAAPARCAPRNDGAISELEDGEVVSPARALPAPRTPRAGLTRSDANVLSSPALDAAAKTALLWRTSPQAAPAGQRCSSRAPPPPPAAEPSATALSMIAKVLCSLRSSRARPTDARQAGLLLCCICGTAP